MKKFTTHQLSVLAYANNFTLWHYDAAADGLSILDVGEKGFWDKAADMLRPRDLIFVSAVDQVRQITVTKNDGGEVVCHLPGMFGEPLVEEKKD